MGMRVGMLHATKLLIAMLLSPACHPSPAQPQRSNLQHCPNFLCNLPAGCAACPACRTMPGFQGRTQMRAAPGQPPACNGASGGGQQEQWRSGNGAP